MQVRPPARTIVPQTRRSDGPEPPVAVSDSLDTDYLALGELQQRDEPTLGCIIPAYNEESSISAVIESLLTQTRVPDVIHIIVNNTTDHTVQVASKFAGPHEVRSDEYAEPQYVEVFVHDIGKNADKKVGALNYGYQLVRGMDYILGVDGDTVADQHAVEHLLAEIASDTRIGGISAIFNIDQAPIRGFIPSFLIAGQRTQFAAFNLQNMLQGRNMAVLGGQFSIFSSKALEQVVLQTHQDSPWVRDSEVEDSLLSLEIKSAGFLTKISAEARAYVGGMNTFGALDAQQVKWNYGGIDLMWPGQRGNTRGQPFHPNLRIRWFESLSMFTNAIVRFMFVSLLIAAATIQAFVFYPFWLLPTVVATLLNLRVALAMKDHTTRDVLFALTFFPVELYMWVRIGHFLRAWTKFFLRRKSTDNWAAQARAERGGGGWSFLWPYLWLVVLIAVTLLIWLQFPIDVKSAALSIGWTILGIVVIIQTLFMVRKLFRSHQGYKV